ncbi:MAG: hypothetical protein Q8929_10585 [Bacillota bacterium]|nr:hypothetical protein [Bacillota bacterium]
MSLQLDTLLQEHAQIILDQFLSIALGGNSFLHPYIEDYYQKNEWEFYEAYQRSELKGNPLFLRYSTNSEDKIRKVAGMVEWCNQNQQFGLLDQLIKKGYKFAYQYLQHRSHIDFDHFMRSYAQRQKSKIVKEIELLYQNIVLWYLCVRENKPFNTMNIAWKSFQNVLSSSINETQLEKEFFSKKIIGKHAEEINELYREYHIPKNLRFDSLGSFIEFLISNNFKQLSETNLDDDAESIEQKVFQESPSKYIGALGGWLKILKIHELDATEKVSFTKTDLDTVFLEILYVKKYNYISNADQDLFFIACLYLKCLSSLYRESKQLYLDSAKQDFYLEMKSKEAQIRNQEADLLRRQQAWEFAHKRQQKEMEGLTEELREAHSKIRQLEQQIENMEDYSEEVHALRNYAYREEGNDYHFDNAPTINTMAEYIQSKRIVIFGGSPNWRQKLKELLPSVEFVDVDDKNRDISKIQRVDAVFINTSVFAHAFYKKIMKELGKSKTPLYYLNGQNNTEKNILEIYEWLTE